MKDWKTNMMAYKRSPLSLILRILVIAAACITMFILCAIIIYILVKGIPNLNLKMFAWHYTSDNVSMTPAIINTVLMVLLTLAFAAPIGIFSAIYLVEYAKRGNKIVLLIRMTTETLAGIPSIVYGLFGFLMFAVAFKWGYSFRIDAGNDGFAYDYENDGRSTESSSGFLQRRKLRTWRRTP